MLYRKDCVCWDHMFDTCNAIEQNWFNRHGCVGCAFHKDAGTYKRQTGGKSYEEIMKTVRIYGRQRYEHKK